jgi:hypothetical protein
MSTAARTEVVSAVEVGVYYPQTDSWSRVLFCQKEQIMLPLLLIIVNS